MRTDLTHRQLFAVTLAILLCSSVLVITGQPLLALVALVPAAAVFASDFERNREPSRHQQP